MAVSVLSPWSTGPHCDPATHESWFRLIGQPVSVVIGMAARHVKRNGVRTDLPERNDERFMKQV